MKKLLSVILSCIIVFTTVLPTFASANTQEGTNTIEEWVSSGKVKLLSKEKSNDNTQYKYKIGNTIETATVKMVGNNVEYTFEDTTKGLKNDVLVTSNGLYIDGSLVKIEEFVDDESFSSSDMLNNTRAGLVDEHWYFSNSPYVSGAYNTDVRTTYKSLTFDRTIISLTLSAICFVIGTALAGVSTGLTAGSLAFTAVETFKSWYENNNPNAKQCWMKTIRSSNKRVDSSFDSATYYYSFKNYYYGDSNRTKLIGNDLSYAKKVMTY